MFTKRTARSAATLALLLATLSTAIAQPAPDPPDLSGPVRIELPNGRSHSGDPISFDNGILVLRSHLRGGTADQGFPQAQIQRLTFPGDDVILQTRHHLDGGHYAEALPLLEALWKQRAPFLTLLQPETLELLAFLPVAHLEVGDPYRAVALAKNLLPHARTPAAAERLRASILRGHYRLRLYEETEQLAKEWIQRQDEFPTSALGWKILAELALRENDLEQVTWLALQPIALAGPEPMAYLNDCYALAIHAYHQRANERRAAQLYDEMIDLRLPWPTQETLAETGAFYQAHANRDDESEAPKTGPDLDLRPPEEELNLPLENVRKRLQKPAS